MNSCSSSSGCRSSSGGRSSRSSSNISGSSTSSSSTSSSSTRSSTAAAILEVDDDCAAAQSSEDASSFSQLRVDYVPDRETRQLVMDVSDSIERFSQGQISAAKFHLDKAVKKSVGRKFFIAHNEGGITNSCLYHATAQAL